MSYHLVCTRCFSSARLPSDHLLGKSCPICMFSLYNVYWSFNLSPVLVLRTGLGV